MSILFMEGFGACTIGSHPPGEDDGLKFQWNTWDDVVSDIDISAYSSGVQGVKKAIRFPTVNTNLIARATWSDSLTEFCFGCRVYREDTDECGIMRLGSRKFIGITSSGELAYSYNSSADLDHATEAFQSTTLLAEDEWTYVEVYVEIATGTTGTVRFYVNGALSDEFTNVKTVASASFADTQVLNMGFADAGLDTAINWKFTDIYFTDGEQLGVVECFYQPCDTAGSAAEFTPSAGSNHENVDEVTDHDGDSTYNESTTPGQKDQLAHNVSHTLGPAAVQAVAWVRGNGADAQVRIGVLSGGITSFSPTEIVTDQQYYPLRGSLVTLDPFTGSAWDASGADDAETVIEHVA